MAKGKLELTLAEQEEQFEWYAKLIRNFAMKPFDLSASKEEIFAELISRTFEKKLEPVDRVYKTIERSYLEHRPEVLREYVSLEDLKLKKPIELLERFFREYIKEDVEPFKNIGDFNDALAKVYVDQIEEIYGDMAFIPSSYINAKANNTFKSRYLKYMADKGYVAADSLQNFFIRADGKGKGGAKIANQRILLEAYETIVKVYIDNYSSFARKDKESFDRFWGMVDFNLERIEGKLTEQSKKDPRFVRNKERARHYFEVILHQSVRNNAKFTEHFKEFEKVKASVDKVALGGATEEDLKRISEFLKMVENVGVALSVVDEKGMNYPVNYYVATKFEPCELIEILTTLQKRQIWTEEQAKKIASTKTKIRQNFPTQMQSPVGKGVKVRDVLNHGFKGSMTKINGVVVDLSKEDVYDKFVESVENTIKQYDLPYSELCISLIGKEFCRKRQAVNFKGAEKTLK